MAFLLDVVVIILFPISWAPLTSSGSYVITNFTGFTDFLMLFDMWFGLIVIDVNFG